MTRSFGPQNRSPASRGNPAKRIRATTGRRLAGSGTVRLAGSAVPREEPSLRPSIGPPAGCGANPERRRPEGFCLPEARPSRSRVGDPRPGRASREKPSPRPDPPSRSGVPAPVGSPDPSVTRWARAPSRSAFPPAREPAVRAGMLARPSTGSPPDESLACDPSGGPTRRLAHRCGSRLETPTPIRAIKVSPNTENKCNNKIASNEKNCV